MSYAGDIALLLFLITIVMTFRNDGSSRKTAFYYSFLGILYYATEMGVYIAVHTVLKNTGFNFFEEVISGLFPSNYLLSVAAFAYLYYFLFHEPKFHNPTKAKRNLFRAASFVPLIYILGSYVIDVLDSFGYISLSIPLSSLLSDQFFLQELVGLVLVYGLFFLNQKSKKHGVDHSSFATLPAMNQNLFLVIAVLFFAVLDRTLCLLFPTQTLHLELGSMEWSIVLLPIFAFYRNDDSEDTHKKTYRFLDWYYTGVYLLLALVYLIVIMAL